MRLSEERKIINFILKERLKELFVVAKQTKCYEYFENLINCKTIQDIAELIIFMRMIEGDNENIKEFADKLKEVFSESVRYTLSHRS